MTRQTKTAAAEGCAETRVTLAQASSVVTKMPFEASPEQVWRGLVFYEELGRRPPAYLRALLPVPIRNEGRIKNVGDQTKCLYERGHLLKRVTKILERELYEFEVTEQALAFGGGMRLSGGRYSLSTLPDGRTEVAVETRYRGGRWPRWFWAPLERMVCHWFHRYLLGSMRRKIELP